MSYLPSNPELSSIANLLTKYPRRGVLLYKLLEYNESDGSPLNKELRGLIIEYISTLNERDSSNYSVEELASDSQRHSQSDVIKKETKTSWKLAPLMVFLKKLTLTPGQINGADVAPIFAAGWSERDFLDLVCLCSVINCIDRLSVGVGFDQKWTFGQ
ncbi:MAG: hypothetical protein HOP23_13720 [Methylococcaceae bacterium]|nr:hypothetical protein [Methylococcaceae bacterium]